VPSKRPEFRTCRQCDDDYKPSHGQRFCSTLCRFMAKVEKAGDGCWNWTAALTSVGYGNFMFPDGNVLAHRWSYVNIGGGTLVSGLVIDHLCRNRRCVNPEHLEQVTQRVNILRGEAPMILVHNCRLAEKKAGR
jgi:hypothetical protein